MAKKNKSSSAASDPDGFKLILRNKRAFHEYEILEKLECGLVLGGTEVKSLRSGHVSFADSYAQVRDNELFILGLNITEYAWGNRLNHDPTRKRKLLVHKRQIRKLRTAVQAKGLTLVPLELYFKRGLAKLELGLARGKALYDKRENIQKRDMDRQKQRIMRSRTR